MRFYGIGNSSPDKVAHHLNIPSKNIYVHPYHSRMDLDRVGGMLARWKEPVMFLNIADVYNNGQVLQDIANEPDLKNLEAFIFGPPLRLIELSNLILLDIEARPNNRSMLGLLKTPNWNLLHTSVDTQGVPVRRRHKFMFTITDNRKGGRFLTPLMTATNCMDAGAQQSIIECVCDTIVRGRTNKALNALVNSVLIEGNLSEIWLVKLLRMMDGEVGASLKEIFARMKAGNGKSSVKGMMKENRINNAEIEYIKWVVEGIAETKGTK